MNSLFLAMTGGALGAGARYLTGLGASRLFGNAWPWGTLIVNIAGGLLIGMLARRTGSDESLRVFLGVGVLGGFTTFSAFSLETFDMIARGAPGTAIGYASVSVITAVAAVGIGMALAR